jgi:nitric oxide reductase NorD protein
MPQVDMPDENIAVELDKVGEVLRLYTKALSGREIHLVASGAGGTRGAGWLTPSDEGKAVVLKLPSKIDRFPSAKENFSWYKVILTHQAGHVEFGTFEFRFAQPSRYFADWRPHLARNRKLDDAGSEVDRFLRLFPDRPLGTAVFEIIEDGRIDARILASYAGIRFLLRRVSEFVAATRPRLALLPLREAFLEALVQASLGGDPMKDASEELQSDLWSALEVFNKIKEADATVEDAAEAALRIYEIAARLPNVPVGECEHEHDQHRPRRSYDVPPDELSDPVADPDELPFTPPAAVEFRLDNDQQFRQFETKTNSDDSLTVICAENDPEGPLARDEPFSYLYPEWDFRAGAYRSRWCRVREQVIDEGTSDFYVETLAEHRPLVAQVTSRFEHFLPELFRKVGRRYDGEDLDLDGLIERVLDRRSDSAPNEKIYWRRERTQRDVAVALLLDMSATTNEYVQLDGAKAHRPSGSNPQAYSEYLKRIAAGIDERGKPLRRRTIDIEKQASIVLCQALEKIGDIYALYAFSGSGRAEVEFYIVKDFRERLGQRVARRIDRLEPAHATRMGAAIRHAIWKLEGVDANTRLLFLISDGRPYDRDYGRDDEDRDYAVQDTRQALLEAKRRKIRPFCLTIDREGEDYLRQMCDEIPYEVVTKVEELPIRLIAAYPRLTA